VINFFFEQEVITLGQTNHVVCIYERFNGSLLIKRSYIHTCVYMLECVQIRSKYNKDEKHL
jgi:hypothetical protein